MERAKQLPYKEPPYCTYQYMAGTGVAALLNPTAYNHYLNLCMVLKCEKTFLTGYTSPRLVPTVYGTCGHKAQFYRRLRNTGHQKYD